LALLHAGEHAVAGVDAKTLKTLTKRPHSLGGAEANKQGKYCRNEKQATKGEGYPFCEAGNAM
jgi:hypothetical protein